MDKLKSVMRSAKGLQYSEVENKIREATSNQSWGASSTDMAEIAGYMRYHGENYTKGFAMLWKRLRSEGQPRHTLKVC